MSYPNFATRFAALNDLLNIANLLTWDFRVMMPPGGAVTRGHQMATLMGLAQDMLMSDETLRVIAAAEDVVVDLPEDSVERRSVAHARAAVDLHRRIPPALNRRRAALNLTGQGIWADARARSDFETLRPVFEEHVAICRELAECIGYENHPHDAMIAVYEPGADTASLAALFARLRAGLAPLVAEIAETAPPRTDFLHGDYPEDRQRIFACQIAEAFGYDFARGRLDIAPHPFEISQTREDVRITTRYHRNNIVSALQGTMHEVGHGLYEQNIAPELTRGVLATDLLGLYGVGGISFGVHESQSRLWENQVGRSRGFWERHFGALHDLFPETLAGVDAETFHRAYNCVRPGLIRVEADELTYDFHIMLRVEMERRLMDGSLRVADMPGAWAEAMQQDLGLSVPDDRHGVLQDMQWSAGQFGIFCGYTIGNVLAAQIQDAAVAAEPGIPGDLDRGDYARLRDWLTENLYRHGRHHDRDETLRRITGRGLDAAPYVAHLTARYREIYALG
jgi:carboxypeptidase Taq